VSRSRRALSARIALSLTAFVPFCILYAADIRASGNAAFIVTESPLRIPAGDAVHFHAYIKTAGVTGGIAALCWQRLDGGVQAMHFDPASINGATGTTGWQPFELNIPPFPVDATIRLGVGLAGRGTAWFNSFVIEIGTQPLKDKLVLDPGRWVRPRGFTNEGYEMTVLRRWMRVPQGADAARENAATLMVSSTGPR